MSDAFDFETQEAAQATAVAVIEPEPQYHVMAASTLRRHDDESDLMVVDLGWGFAHYENADTVFLTCKKCQRTTRADVSSSVLENSPAIRVEHEASCAWVPALQYVISQLRRGGGRQ